MNQLRAMLLALALAVLAVLAGHQWYVARQASVMPAPPGELSPTASRAPQSQPPPALNSKQRLAATRQLIAGRLGDAPEFTAFFAAFEKNFPTAHARVFDHFAENAAKGGRIESPDLYLAQALRGLRSSHGVLASHASPEALEKVFDMQAGILKILAASNPALCADFLYGAASEPFFRFSAGHRSQVAAMANAGLAAMVDGKEKRLQRALPDAKEFALLEAALRKKGLEKPEIEMLLDGKTPEPPLADSTVCRAGTIYFETLRSIPQDTRLKIYSLAIRLMARS